MTCHVAASAAIDPMNMVEQRVVAMVLLLRVGGRMVVHPGSLRTVRMKPGYYSHPYIQHLQILPH